MLNGAPTYEPGLRVAFSLDTMQITNAYTAADPQVFAVLRNTQANLLNYFLGDEDGGFFSGGTFWGGFGLYDGASATRSGTAHDGALNVFSIGTGSVYRNGTALALAESAAGEDTFSRLGGRTSTNTDLRFVGEIYELILVDGALPEADRWKMEGYLAHKWGIEGRLPSDHPYRDAPWGAANTSAGTVIYGR